MSCESNDDCVVVDDIVGSGCGSCVHKSAENVSQELFVLREEYISRGEDCESFSCPAIATWCGCINNTCQDSFSGPSS